MLHKHEALSLNPSASTEKLNLAVSTYDPSAREAKTRGSWELRPSRIFEFQVQ